MIYKIYKKAGKVIKLGNTRFYKSLDMGIFDLMASQVIFNSGKGGTIGKDIDW